MTPAQFRKLALELPGSVESAHMSHPDFRVHGRVFATISQDGDMGVLKLTPQQQAAWTGKHPRIFSALNGAWGERGYTKVVLEHAKTPVIRSAMKMAFENVAAGTRGGREPTRVAKPT